MIGSQFSFSPRIDYWFDMSYTSKTKSQDLISLAILFYRDVSIIYVNTSFEQAHISGGKTTFLCVFGIQERRSDIMAQIKEVLPTPSSPTTTILIVLPLILFNLQISKNKDPLIIIISLQMSFNCISLPNSTLLRLQFPIVESEKISYLSLGVLSLIFAIFNIIAIIKVKALREPPTDILLILMIFSIIKTLVIFVTMIYDAIYSPSQIPLDFNNFCLATGVFSSFAHSIKIVYSIVLSLLYIQKVKNPLKAWMTDSKQIHFICLFIVFVITLSLVFTDSIGMTIYGYCSVKFSSQNIYVWPIIDLCFLIAIILVSVIFLRRVRKLSASRQVINQFFKLYFWFMVFFGLNQFIITASEFIVLVECQNEDNIGIFNTFRIISNVSCFSISFFVFAIFMRNPQFRRTIMLSLTKDLYEKYKKTIQFTRRKTNDTALQRTSFYDELLTTNRNSIFIEMTKMDNLQNGYLVNLKDKNRACLLSSVLGCLCIQFIQFKNCVVPISNKMRTSLVQQDQQQFFSWNYHEYYSFIVNREIVESYQDVFTNKMPTLYIKFVIYAPAIMKTFAQMNKESHFQQKLSPIMNEEAIINDCKTSAEGGRSGQFFFFNTDNTLIIKTMSSSEKTTFLQRLGNFHEYFTNEPNSLIVKLYSIFSVINVDTHDQIHFMLMGNMLRGLDQQYVLRCYDLKGSMHHRQVMKNQSVSEGQRIKKTLKDTDFLNLQQKVWISEEDSRFLKKSIIKDSELFCSLGLIDYSLIVMKIDVHAIQKDEYSLKILKELRVFRSQKQKGFGYVFGIIDYLETWNIRKKGQKWYKSLFVKADKISSQNPFFYSQRFIDFTKQIFAKE